MKYFDLLTNYGYVVTMDYIDNSYIQINASTNYLKTKLQGYSR